MTKRVLVWMPKGEQVKGVPVRVCPPVDLPQEGVPDRIWTLYSMCNPEIKPPLQMPLTHLDGVFLEDKLHDWVCNDGKLIYRSRVSDGGHWIMFEYLGAGDGQ